MSEDRKTTSEEITDEQANEAAGGYIRVTASREFDTCYLCGSRKSVDDMIYISKNGVMRHVCCKCANVR